MVPLSANQAKHTEPSGDSVLPPNPASAVAHLAPNNNVHVSVKEQNKEAGTPGMAIPESRSQQESGPLMHLPDYYLTNIDYVHKV